MNFFFMGSVIYCSQIDRSVIIITTCKYIALKNEDRDVTADQIEQWAKAGESETMEFKRTTGERREATHTLCAMLNHRGGRVLFGVEPNRNVRGQQVSDKTLEDVAQEIKEIDPPVFPSIERVPI